MTDLAKKTLNNLMYDAIKYKHQSDEFKLGYEVRQAELCERFDWLVTYLNMDVETETLVFNHLINSKLGR